MYLPPWVVHNFPKAVGVWDFCPLCTKRFQMPIRKENGATVGILVSYINNRWKYTTPGLCGGIAVLNTKYLHGKTYNKKNKKGQHMVPLGTSYQTVSWVTAYYQDKRDFGCACISVLSFVCGVGGWGVRGPKLHKEGENVMGESDVWTGSSSKIQPGNRLNNDESIPKLWSTLIMETDKVETDNTKLLEMLSSIFLQVLPGRRDMACMSSGNCPSLTLWYVCFPPVLADVMCMDCDSWACPCKIIMQGRHLSWQQSAQLLSGVRCSTG